LVGQFVAYTPPTLPLAFDIETKPVLKSLASAHRCLAELKGVAGLVPNEGILLNTLALQEAKDSSAIENIVTTHDDLYWTWPDVELSAHQGVLDRAIVWHG